MKGAKVAAAEERPEEKEMDLLLSEIPQLTSPQGLCGAVAGAGQGLGVHGAARHHGYEDAYYAVVPNRRGDGGHQGSDGFHAPLPVGSAPLPPSGPFVGSAPSSLVQAVDDPERQWLSNQLRGLLIGGAPAAEAQVALKPQDSPAAPVKNAPADFSAAHGAYYGLHYGAPGSSVHHEPLFVDQAKTAGYVPRSQRFAMDVSPDGYGGFPRTLDPSIGGYVYNRTRNGAGIGWGQGLVHPGHGEPFLLPGQAGAEHNWGYPVALDARGRPVRSPKLHYEYGVAVADNGYMKGGFNQMEAFRCEDSMIFDGRRNVPFLNRGKDRRFQQYVNSRRMDLENLRYENMVGDRGCIYFMAKDQNGCRLLQQKFEEGKYQVDVIFEGIIDHIAELMTNSFANYLIQKLLDVCDEEQRLRIIAVVTEDPVKLLRISLNTHGTRAVQKLIETVKSRKQIMLIISAIRPSFIHLVNDLNGNHVVQKCLEYFRAEENKFLFEAAATHCYEMAKHRHGCCVLQRFILTAYGEYQAKLIVGVCAHGLELAQDPFGNYVVQYVVELKVPSANANLASQFEGRYVSLSKLKITSNVVEKCLKHFSDDDKATIVFELISVANFEQLLQDPFANYVIYTALVNSRGHLHNALVEAIRPHEEALRTNPCCKRISRALNRR